SKEKLATIWDAFIKVHDAAVDQKMQRHQGLGLGLAIVRQFVTQMNGEVGVKSIVGEGSKFYLTLPIAD
ncbi:MAG: hypothetical protein GW809_04030, partial [Bacteroidetes bacterium]|nr:hypothetical protein [Bacteroidota bacterium]